MERAIRTNDPYVNIEILPDPSTHIAPAPTMATAPNSPVPSTSAGLMPPPQPPLDIGFVMALASDPYKALDLAKNTGEVEQARQAIKELESVSVPKTLTKSTSYPTQKKPNFCKTKSLPFGTGKASCVTGKCFLG